MFKSLCLNTYHKNSLHFAPIYDKVSVLQKMDGPLYVY